MINTSACYLHRKASLEGIHEAVHFFQQRSYNMKAQNHLQSLAIGHPASSVIGRPAPYVLLLILYYYFLSKVCFNLPSLTLFLRTLPYSLYSGNFTFQIHLFTFKFVSFIFTPYKTLLLPSHPFNI